MLYIPDSRLEMPELLYPGRKPTGQVQVDWNHKAVRGLKIAALIDGINWRIVHGADSSTNDTTGTPADTIGSGGQGANYGVNDYQTLMNNARNDEAGHTFLFIRSCNDTTDRACVTWGAAPNNNQRFSCSMPWSDGNVYYDYGGTSGPNRITWTGYTKVADVVEVWVFRGGSLGLKMWLDGDLKQSSATAASVNQQSEDFDINQGAAVGVAGDSQVVYAAFMWGEELPDLLIESLSRDPYQFLIPA